MTPTASWLLAASTALGLAVAWPAGWVAATVLGTRVDPAGASSFERERRGRLRRASLIYRWFEPWVDALVVRTRTAAPSRPLQALALDLVRSDEPVPWSAAEYRAAKTIEAAVGGGAGFVFGLLLFGDPIAAAPVGLLAAWGYRRIMLRGVADRSRRRLAAFLRRLPYAVDLMALMMEAGAGFQEALGVVARENRENPLGVEFGAVLREVSLGKTRREALDSLRQRLSSDDVSELIFAITKGEELGTPLSQILRAQSRQLLTKHSLWIEKSSAEAQVLIVFPGMLIMVACLLIVTAPFLLSAVSSR